MERVEKTIEVGRPLRTVYNQWTQFEDFPEFMAGVKEVRQIDDTHVHWHAEIWGKDKEWDAEIVEQVPDQCIAWRSTSGAYNAGTVRFEPLGPDRTCVRLEMTYEPEGVVENVADAVGIFSARVQHTVGTSRISSSTAGSRPARGVARCTAGRRWREKLRPVIPTATWATMGYPGVERAPPPDRAGPPAAAARPTPIPAGPPAGSSPTRT
jgi:ribosome-associated toxin RatA of RatAB toxin-antitoxin module